MRSNADLSSTRTLRFRPAIAPGGARGAPAAPPRRWLPIAAAIAAAAALIAACLGDSWLEDAPDRFGLLDHRLCAGMCVTGSNFELARFLNEAADERAAADASLPPRGRHAPIARPPSVFAPAGLVALVSLGLAAGGLLVAAALAVARRRYRLPVAPTTLALLGLASGIIAACVFVATQPLKAHALYGPGWSFWVFAAGAIGGLAATFMIQPEIRPVDPEPEWEPAPWSSLSW